MPDLASIRVLVVGAGPGGLRAAHELHAAGVSVSLIERQVSGVIDPARRALVKVRESAFPDLRAIGAGPVLDDPLTFVDPPDTPARGAVLSLLSIDDAGRSAFARSGGDVHMGTKLLNVTLPAAETRAPISVELEDIATHQHVHREFDWVIATGDHSPAARAAPELAKHPQPSHTSELPSSVTFVTAEVGHRPNAGFVEYYDASQSRITNDARAGVSQIYGQLDGPEPPGSRNPSALQALLKPALDGFGLHERDLRSPPRMVHVQQALADAAISGHLIAVGDTIATHLPETQVGVSQALDDGHRAAMAIIESVQHPEREAKILHDYDETVRVLHRIEM